MDSVRKQATFFWFIESYSYCWHQNGQPLINPEFTADKLEDTAWELWLYPRGYDDKFKDCISLYLRRSPADNGPEYLSVKFELSILAEDGSVFSSKEYDHLFQTTQWQGSGDFLKMNESLYHRNFPRDVLTVRCRMWRGEGEVRRVAPICFRTRIGVETVSFVHEVDNFSSLLPNQNHTIRIPSHLKKECFVFSVLYFTRDSCPAGEMRVEITTSDSDYILCRRRISLLGFWNRILHSEDDNRFDIEKKDIRKLPLSFTRQKILNKENKYFPGDKLYLPGDKLTMLFECSFSTGQKFDQIEDVEHNLPIAVPDENLNKNVCNALGNASAYPSVSEDMKKLYMDKCLADIDIKTKTKSFPAHKMVLCARSPVFNRMLAIDMKERNTDCIEVDDLGDDVVQQLLLFLYSDTVQNLEWAMATRLYYAADKYEVGRLKAVCSSLLVEHLNPGNAGEFLLLADTHSDGDLKGVVEDFILEHEEEVFGSEEWEMLLKMNPVLAGETMRLKYKRKKTK
ncbi:unnamed protein product [Larinioides sclopetarius]|uniref:Speckle-type POZ protein n=1 Tax=Larinioides sclopetarius TaxID=280406 RepID=A0AAV2AYE9_9ARAC